MGTFIDGVGNSYTGSNNKYFDAEDSQHGGEVRAKKRPSTQASPKGSVELEKKLISFGDDIVVLDMMTRPGAIVKPGYHTVEQRNLEIRKKAKEIAQAITVLHDADIEYVIGEDDAEPNEMNRVKSRRNAFRAEQRQRWQDRRGKSENK